MRGFARWSDEDIAKLKTLLGTMPTRELAIALGRSQQAIWRRMKIDGLEGPRIRLSSAKLAKIQERNAEGHSDCEIAAELGSCRHVVTAWRKRLGLPCNALGDRRRALVAEKTRQQVERVGLSSLAEVRSLSLRVRVIRSGWPTDLRWVAVQILDLLEQRGPMTRRDIAESLGKQGVNIRYALQSNEPGGGGTYLSNLMRRGLVVRLGRIVRGDGPCRNTVLYSLALGVERRKTQ